jgi:hypothetical protein
VATIRGLLRRSRSNVRRPASAETIEAARPAGPGRFSPPLRRAFLRQSEHRIAYQGREPQCSNFVIRKLLGDITVPFVEAAVERMFNADEVTSVVDLAKLECLKRKIVSLFFTQRELI